MLNEETRISSDLPTEVIVETPPRPAPARRNLSWLIATLLGLILAVGGAAFGWLLNEDNQTPTVVSQQGVNEQPISVVTSPAIASTEEPVAAVASALLPSMVQISIPGGGLGSGFVYEDGHVLTAAHVVEGVETVSVRFANGSQSEGSVVGTDPAHDIGVIQVVTEGIPAARLALDEELEVGQLAVALGSPWGLDQTVTSGVVSAVNRPIWDFDSPQVLIQTDASINPGNSGGALADREGRVIGVNIEIFTTTGANQGVGFAVPITNAYEFASNIVAGTPIEAAYLGVTGDNATGAQSGALIAEITAGSAAAQGGLEVGDIVTAVDALAVSSIDELAAHVRSYLPGDEVVLDVIRDGDAITLRVTLGILPS